MSTLHQETLVTSSAGEVTGRWWWDESRPWVLYLTVPDATGGGHTVARIGREPLSLALRGLPLAVCRPDVQIWLDTEFGPEPVLRIQLNPPAGVELRTVRWRTCPTVAAEFLAKTQARVEMCLRPKDCKDGQVCAECAAIADRIDILAARRGVA